MPSKDAVERERLTVIVPCLNEADSLHGTVAEILAERDELPVELHVLLCDDGSTDNTRAIMEEICAKHENCRMLVNPENLGLGRTVTNAYREIAPRSWVTVVPGDGEFVFSSIHDFLAHRHHADVVLGYIRNPVIRSFHRRLASHAYSTVVNALYGFEYRYLNGFKMYRLEAFDGIETVAGGHATAVELLAKALLRDPSLRIVEESFVWRVRQVRRSNAFRPHSILRAVRETRAAFVSVREYRAELHANPIDDRSRRAP